MYQVNPNYGQEDSTLVVARFENREAARECYSALKALFAEIDQQLDILYAANNGQASLEDIQQLYSPFGFTNDNGWHQSAPITLEGNELIWPLDAGVQLEDVEMLLSALDATAIQVFAETATLEDWQRFPHPIIMPLPDDEEEAFALPILKRNNPGGRRLH